MIKRTLYFCNACELRRRDNQLVVAYVDAPERTVPMEDIGVVVIDSDRVRISHAVLRTLLEHNAAVITCAENHMPLGLLLNLDGHHVQTERFRHQLESSLPLRKQLWAQTVAAKIRNQAALLQESEIQAERLLTLARNVRSGDPDNTEAQASAYYWPRIFAGYLEGFVRDRYGQSPNNLLNYGYAILRAVTARSLVASGLLPTMGIFHRNRYNAYCLADDIMEPYRPYVDRMVLDMVVTGQYGEHLDTALKAELLKLPVTDVTIDGQSSPLMVAMQRTTAGLARCFAGEQRKIDYPSMDG